MQAAHLSSERHLIIPTAILEACHLSAGQELEIEITPQGILLKTPNALPGKTSVNDLIGCTGYQGKAKSLEEMDAAIEERPSKWAKFVQEIENTPELQLGDYAKRLKTDLCELREDFVFTGV